MAKNIFFIDTCILLEILQVPQKFNIKDSETHTEIIKREIYRQEFINYNAYFCHCGNWKPY
jgi:hypothetical protein